MKMKTYKFTSRWVIGPISGDEGAPPRAEEGYIAVQYLDEGYMGGEYWAVVPKDWTVSAAAYEFAAQHSCTSLRSVNGVQVPDDVWNELWGDDS